MSLAIHDWFRFARICQNQDLQDWRDWRDLQDFIIAQITIFAITENPVKTIADEALASRENARLTNPVNPIILKILILTNATTALARGAPILAFPHQGERDLSLAPHA